MPVTLADPMHIYNPIAAVELPFCTAEGSILLSCWINLNLDQMSNEEIFKYYRALRNKEIKEHCTKLKERLVEGDMDLPEEELEDVLTSTPYRYKDTTCAKVTDAVFEVALSKMKDADDKAVVEKL